MHIWICCLIQTQSGKLAARGHFQLRKPSKIQKMHWHGRCQLSCTRWCLEVIKQMLEWYCNFWTQNITEAIFFPCFLNLLLLNKVLQPLKFRIFYGSQKMPPWICHFPFRGGNWAIHGGKKNKLKKLGKVQCASLFYYTARVDLLSKTICAGINQFLLQVFQLMSPLSLQTAKFCVHISCLSSCLEKEIICSKNVFCLNRSPIILHLN